jgi:hypothetical protein
MDFDKLVENMKKADLDPSKRIGKAGNRMDAADEFKKFLDRKRVSYINNIDESDFRSQL